MSKIMVYHTHIEITNYDLGDCPKLENHLSIYDSAIHKRVPFGYEYDEEKRILLIPRGVNHKFLENLFDERVELVYTSDPYDEISIKLKVAPRDDVQKQAISFLTGRNEFAKTLATSQLVLELGTGVGKTYVATASLTTIGYKSMVITHTDKIQQQWIESLLKFTDLTERDICIIKGGSAIKRLVKDNNLKYKVYLVHHATLNRFLKNNGREAMAEFFKHLKIGVKIYDEAHLHFGNILRIDSCTNTKKTIYLTATFRRSQREETNIFKVAFANVSSFGAEHKKTRKKHINYLAMIYNSHPRMDQVAYMETFKGFSKMRYSDYVSECKDTMTTLDRAIKHFLKYEGKILVLSNKIDTVEIIREHLKKSYPDLIISRYHSGVSAEEKINAFDADIICSTPQSTGTGTDIPGLRTLISLESYTSSVEAEQIPGRLRPYNNGDVPTYYIELIDKGFKKLWKAYKKRLPVLESVCLNLLELGEK